MEHKPTSALLPKNLRITAALGVYSCSRVAYTIAHTRVQCKCQMYEKALRPTRTATWLPHKPIGRLARAAICRVRISCASTYVCECSFLWICKYSHMYMYVHAWDRAFCQKCCLRMRFTFCFAAHSASITFRSAFLWCLLCCYLLQYIYAISSI